MTVLLVVAMFVMFVLADLLVRTTARHFAARRTRKEREAALAAAVRLEFTEEAPTLKRVEVEAPKARILAVDDEPVILDALRKVLVLDGFAVDTVESGPEALGLMQRHDYDLVFTDLKMPGMDGVEVVKGVKYLRPDVDVAVITGFATIESAVETMRDGAVDYVQKPFTADELVAFVRRLILKRQARLEAQRRPRVRVVTPGFAEAVEAGEFCVPGGAFLSDGHAWVRIEPSGQVRVGLDDFARQALGTIERIELAREGVSLGRGDPLVTLHRERASVQVAAPLSGRVVAVNPALGATPELLVRSPYDDGWLCLLEPNDLAAQLTGLHIGAPVIDWYQNEIARLRALGGRAENGAPQVDWRTLQSEFFASRGPA
jgi:CheY-like chemotaxis protein